MTVSAPACPTCGRRPRSRAGQARLFEPGPPEPPGPAPRICRPEDLAALVVPHLAGRDREHCLLVALDVRHRLLELRTVSVGCVDSTYMEPREIFRDALLAGAVRIAVAHNHPSGDPEPSAEDRVVTRRLARAGELLGVPLLDHLIVGGRSWRSLGRMGVFPCVTS